ncbi:MAG TPA: FAD-dependent monooxygenase [Streptosporangiaceae bacterium]|jgi:anthraniloyl-CoA monooxygenase
MRIAVIGGGPGGLYFAALARQLGQDHEVTVWEQNAADTTTGFGIVFSDWSLGGIERADPVIDRAISAEVFSWDAIDVQVRGETVRSRGHRLRALSRMRLLRILHDRCRSVGVDLRFSTQAPPVDELAACHDLVVAADGISSPTRARYADVFRPQIVTGRCKYMWLGTDRVFDAFKLFVQDTPYGVMQVHAYPYAQAASTFSVEMHERVWRAAGFGDMPQRQGTNDDDSMARLAEMFAGILGGHRLIGSNPRWLSFATVRTATWRHGNVVLLGDAAHTAHYSIGPGTKLAMEDALTLAECLRAAPRRATGPALARVIEEYEAERRPPAASVQRAAQGSLEWLENLGDFHSRRHPVQLAFSFLTRSLRVTRGQLRQRDTEFVARADRWMAGACGLEETRPPMFLPFRLRGLTVKNRVIVSPMGMFSAEDGVPGDFHLVHLGAKALGGAGLVMTEMVSPSPGGRVTHRCTGMYTPGHEASWRRIAEFVHQNSTAAIGMQLGHSGRKGSSRMGRKGMDHVPLRSGNWDLVAPSPVPYRPGVSQVPRELDEAEMTEIRQQFTQAAGMAARAGFDLLELHCAHGYLLSSFISPLTNQRRDRYGGSLENRLRFPLEVFDAVRAAWPGGRPLTVRISATDWVAGGIDVDQAVEVARAFAAHGVDAIHVSTGQVIPDEVPGYGRLHQVPFAEKIRGLAGVPTIAVGGITSADDVNTIILAGRADLCSLGRIHLSDPQWTLRAAAEEDYAGPGADWPAPFIAGAKAARPRRGPGSSGPPRTGAPVIDGAGPRPAVLARNR